MTLFLLAAAAWLVVGFGFLVTVVLNTPEYLWPRINPIAMILSGPALLAISGLFYALAGVVGAADFVARKFAAMKRKTTPKAV